MNHASLSRKLSLPGVPARHYFLAESASSHASSAPTGSTPASRRHVLRHDTAGAQSFREAFAVFAVCAPLALIAAVWALDLDAIERTGWIVSGLEGIVLVLAIAVGLRTVLASSPLQARGRTQLRDLLDAPDAPARGA